MGFHKRLIQRFNEGIYQAIDSPEFEMRVAFLRAYINKNKFKYNNGENIIFSLDQISYIASMISSSIRELVGAVKNIVNVSIIYEKPITEDLIDTAIKDFILGPTKDITLEKIINAVRDYYGFSEEEIKGVSRNADLVEARHIAMYITRQLTQITLVEIGRFFKRDHSAVINGDRRIRELIIQNKLINTKVNNIIQKIKN